MLSANSRTLVLVYDLGAFGDIPFALRLNMRLVTRRGQRSEVKRRLDKCKVISGFVEHRSRNSERLARLHSHVASQAYL